MADTFFAHQVDGGNLVSAEEDAVVSVRCERSDSEAFAAERLWDLPGSALEVDIGLGGGDAALAHRGQPGAPAGSGPTG